MHTHGRWIVDSFDGEFPGALECGEFDRALGRGVHVLGLEFQESLDGLG